MKVIDIPVVTCALGAVNKELVQELKDLKIREREETLQIATLFRSTRIQRRVQEIPGTLIFGMSSPKGAQTAYSNSYRLGKIIISDEFIKFIEKTMKNWRVELKTEEKPWLR